MMERKEKCISVLKNNLNVIKLIFSSAPLLGGGLIFDAFRAEFVNYLEHTYGVKFVLNNIEQQGKFGDIIKFICLLLGIQVISAICSNIYSNYIETKYLPHVYQAAKKKIYNKIIKIDLQYYDNPQFYDDQVVALTEVEQIINRQKDLVKKVVSTLTILICYGTFFVRTDLISTAFVLGAFLIQFVAHSIVSKLDVHVRMEQYKAVKKTMHINRLFYLKDYAKELRIYKKITERFVGKYHEALDCIYEEEKKVRFRRIFLYFLIQFVGNKFAYNVVYMLYLIYRTVILHSLSISSLVVLFNSTNSLRQGFVGMTELIPTMVANSMYIEKVNNFLALEPRLKLTGDIDVPTGESTIEFRNVCFAYPNTEKEIITNLNLSFSLTDSIALVGYNGAGKTTIIKLLLRFYDPTSGYILLNGIDIRNYKVDRYRAMFSAIFQDYNMYAISIYENIAMDLVCESSKRKIDELLKKFGVNTILTQKGATAENVYSKEFSERGIDFSGGEIQRVVLARGDYLSCKGIIFDEPSSALDPIAEYELNNIICELINDKMVLLISHRFSTIRNINKIYVIENGRNIEEGTHDELLAKHGRYYQLWDAQTELYQ